MLPAFNVSAALTALANFPSSHPLALQYFIGGAEGSGILSVLSAL